MRLDWSEPTRLLDSAPWIQSPRYAPIIHVEERMLNDIIWLWALLFFKVEATANQGLGFLGNVICAP